jgi:hypothetical protein
MEITLRLDSDAARWLADYLQHFAWADYRSHGAKVYWMVKEAVNKAEAA